MNNYKSLLVLSIFLFTGLLACDDSATKQEIEKIKETQAAIQKDIKEIKDSLDSPRKKPQRPEFEEVVLSVAGNYVKGSEDAPITVVEFSDYQCPFCGRHVKNTYPQIEEEYIKTGKVKYFFADFPLAFHKEAPEASEAALCAGDQGKFWEMHDVLFNNQRALQAENLPKYAAEAGVADLEKFNKCLSDDTYKKTVDDNLEMGKKAGIRGTPSFLLGYSTPDNKDIKFVSMIRGARPFASFKSEIDPMLSDKEE